MKPSLTKATLVYDGNCGFCRAWILRWSRMTGGDISYASWQEIAESGSKNTLFKRIQEENLEEKDFKDHIVLLNADKGYLVAANAAFEIIPDESRWSWLKSFYKRSSPFRQLSEAIYRLIARNRSSISKFIKFFSSNGRESHTISSDLFLRGLGFVYLTAFLSYKVQFDGLNGTNGILPANNFLNAVLTQITGFDRYWKVPTVFWMAYSDTLVHNICYIGSFLGILLIFGIRFWPFLSILWVFYLSLISVSGAFFGFQWDNLLLECGILAILLGTNSLKPTLPFSISSKYRVNRPLKFIFVLLGFKLMLSSGVVKLSSGDLTWSTHTALTYHYLTQPLPLLSAWYAHHMPEFVHIWSCRAMFLIELALPFAFFGSRKAKITAFFGSFVLMALIFVTGNYTYFNILTVIVLLWLLDDKFYAFIGLGNKKAGFYQKFLTISPKTFTLTLIFSLFVVPLSLKQTVDAFRLDIQWPQILTKVERVLAPFRSINSYGLFQVITTERREIVIEGSHHPDDESSWQAYEFPYKPGGNLKGGLAWVQPHQPRLDWQMWFAALSTPDRNQWYSQMLIRLLHGQPEVLKLFAHNPFPDKAPQYLRASLYRYDFTSPAEKAASGNYWKRERLGPYHQPIYLLPPKKKP